MYRSRRAGTLGTVASFVIEQYLPGSDRAARAGEIARVHALRNDLAALGARHVQSVAIPADEMCMYLFEADSEADVIVAYRRARLPYDRIVEVELAE